MSISIKCDGAACSTVGESSSPYSVVTPVGWGVLNFSRERPGQLDAGTASLRDMVAAGPADDPRLGQMKRALDNAALRVAPELVSFSAHLCPACVAKIDLDNAVRADD